MTNRLPPGGTASRAPARCSSIFHTCVMGGSQAARHIETEWTAGASAPRRRQTMQAATLTTSVKVMLGAVALTVGL